MSQNSIALLIMQPVTSCTPNTKMMQQKYPQYWRIIRAGMRHSQSLGASVWTLENLQQRRGAALRQCSKGLRHLRPQTLPLALIWGSTPIQIEKQNGRPQWFFLIILLMLLQHLMCH